MGNERGGAKDVMAAGVGHGQGDAIVVPAPKFLVEAECFSPEGLRWRDGYTNVVVNGGRAFVINHVFGSITASTAGCFLWPHGTNATASGHAWTDISASRVLSFGNNVPVLTFASNGTAASQSASVSISFNASTQTVQGAAVLFYTSASMSTNAATADILEYSEGLFAGGSRQVQANDTLQMSVTISYQTA